MAYPVRAGQQGVWSMRAARALLGVPDRLVREVGARGLVPRTDLRAGDLLAIQVLAATAGFDAQPGLKDLRDQAVANSARQAWDSPSRDERLVLLVSAVNAWLITPDRFDALTMALGAQPGLLLPVGLWARDLRERVG